MHQSLQYNTLGFKKIKETLLKTCVNERTVIYSFLRLEVICETFMMDFSVMK